MNDSPSKKFGQNSQNRSKSKKDDAELGLKDATNKLNTSGSFNKTDNKELSNTQKSGVFKSLLGGFKKHKPDNISPSKLKETNMEVELKLMESGYTIRKKDKSSNKSKFINRRNITDGKIQIMRLDNNDVVDENYDIPTKENIYELLDQIPAKVSSHLENRKTGKFSWISKRAIKNLMETKAKSQKPLRGDHMEDDLINLISDMTEFYHKLFFFFQGLLSGLSVMHLMLIYLNNNDSANISSYSLIALRLNQLFHIVSLLAVFGSIFRAMHVKKLFNESLKSQNETLAKDRKSFFKNSFGAVCFVIVYAIIIYNHEFAAKISKVASTSFNTGDYTSIYGTWKVLNIIQSIFSFLGWMVIVSESDLERPAEMYDEIDEEENEKGVV